MSLHVSLWAVGRAVSGRKIEKNSKIQQILNLVSRMFAFGRSHSDSTESPVAAECMWYGEALVSHLHTQNCLRKAWEKFTRWRQEVQHVAGAQKQKTARVVQAEPVQAEQQTALGQTRSNTCGYTR